MVLYKIVPLSFSGDACEVAECISRIAAMKTLKNMQLRFRFQSLNPEP